ncbi:hypothetical protein CI238_05863 [Colletotrichum incanum]|uniref:Uncharacterized protein n=1 Tax=Colletotrichum incanum TaxID=1573173 RepID=A0A162P0B8_COLIC|nr:hypothetical protein CI238_05863 [Colletotrichum incanum]
MGTRHLREHARIRNAQVLEPMHPQVLADDAILLFQRHAAGRRSVVEVEQPFLDVRVDLLVRHIPPTALDAPGLDSRGEMPGRVEGVVRLAEPLHVVHREAGCPAGRGPVAGVRDVVMEHFGVFQRIGRGELDASPRERLHECGLEGGVAFALFEAVSSVYEEELYIGHILRPQSIRVVVSLIDSVAAMLYRHCRLFNGVRAEPGAEPCPRRCQHAGLEEEEEDEVPESDEGVEHTDVGVDEADLEGDAEGNVVLKVGADARHVSHEWDFVLCEVFLWADTTMKGKLKKLQFQTWLDELHTSA